MPRLLNYVVAIYLIIIGVLGLLHRNHVRTRPETFLVYLTKGGDCPENTSVSRSTCVSMTSMCAISSHEK